MAKEKINLDQFFKEKLSQDSIKPSKLAWERLESQLPATERKIRPIAWWAVAASVGILFLVGYLTLQNNFTEEPQVLLTEETSQIPVSPENNASEIIMETQSEDQKEKETGQINPESAQSEPQSQEKRNRIEKSTSTAPQNFIARSEEKKATEDTSSELKALEVEPIEVPTLKIPNLQVNQTVAARIEEPEAETPVYTVKIFSDGIEEKKEDKNLIAEIGKKVEKVEGLLGKVDQGFADLQDAKNNLFTALITKKEKLAEKP